MLKQVLESIDEMLHNALQQPESGPMIAKVYVQCAKTLLRKTIDSMELPPTVATTKADKVTSMDKSIPFGGIDAEIDQFQVEAVNGKLAWIKNQHGVEMDGAALVDLNGTAMTYREAKGKAFQTMKLL